MSGTIGMRGVAAATGVAWLLVLLQACGGAQKPQDAKSPDAAAGGVAAEGGGDGDGDAAPDADDPAPPAPPPQQGQMVTSPNLSSGQKLSSIEEAEEAVQASVSAIDKLLSGDGSTELSSGDGCSRACNAFASLQRSANRLCEMAGEDDARCSSARSKVSENQTRISNAGCSCS